MNGMATLFMKALVYSLYIHFVEWKGESCPMKTHFGRKDKRMSACPLF